jgi:hypothetical protein
VKARLQELFHIICSFASTTKGRVDGRVANPFHYVKSVSYYGKVEWNTPLFVTLQQSRSKASGGNNGSG